MQAIETMPLKALVLLMRDEVIPALEQRLEEVDRQLVKVYLHAPQERG